ncbi:hypothetical protein GCM10010166_52050 [Couchioplanes caeruleus subsp. azureus]|nr:hypothetical protein GCM10010166_52050 [Couchioplanes caeruleus subsp. azureus]
MRLPAGACRLPGPHWSPRPPPLVQGGARITDAKAAPQRPAAENTHGGEFRLSMTTVTVWDDIVAVLSAWGAPMRPPGAGRSGSPAVPSRQTVLHVRRREEHRLYR